MNKRSLQVYGGVVIPSWCYKPIDAGQGGSRRSQSREVYTSPSLRDTPGMRVESEAQWEPRLRPSTLTSTPWSPKLNLQLDLLKPFWNADFGKIDSDRPAEQLSAIDIALKWIIEKIKRRLESRSIEVLNVQSVYEVMWPWWCTNLAILLNSAAYDLWRLCRFVKKIYANFRQRWSLALARRRCSEKVL